MAPDRKSSFFEELKRRNVIRTAIAYALAAWLLLQISDVLFPALGLPDWTIRLVAGLLLLGFPFTLLFAWAFDITPDGIRRDTGSESRDGAASSRRLDVATLIVAAIAIALFAFDRLVPEPSADPSTDEPAAQEDKRETTIAVLPFVNVSSDEEQEYFSDGLTEELSNALSSSDELSVIGRTSTFQFKDKQVDLRDIGRQLNATHLLDGSVRKSASSVRISVQLIDASSGVQLWSANFDRTLDDIFAVQDEIAASVSSKLQVTLLGGAVAGPDVRNPEAYDWYLKGLRARRLPGPDNLRQAVDHFRKALSIDPELAVAWEHLGDAYQAMTVAGMLPTADGAARAQESVERALALDPLLADAHAVQGGIYMTFDFDWQAADAAFERALEIDPSNENALNGVSLLAMGLGRYEDAVRYNSRSISVDPLNLRALHNRAFIHYAAGRDFEKAESALREAIEFAGGNYLYAHTVLSLILLEQGRIEEAVVAVEQELGEPFRLAAESIVYYEAGRRDEAQLALDELIDRFPDRLAVPIAGSYAIRGDVDTAMMWLERAYEQGDPQLQTIGVHPANDNLQGDPRFQALLRKLDLPAR